MQSRWRCTCDAGDRIVGQDERPELWHAADRYRARELIVGQVQHLRRSKIAVFLRRKSCTVTMRSRG